MTYLRFAALCKTDTFSVHNATTKIAGVKINADGLARITATRGRALRPEERQSIAAYIENMC
jgi:hypothetical protein